MVHPVVQQKENKVNLIFQMYNEKKIKLTRFSYQCTIGCTIILTFIVNDMGSHRMHTYIVPCICSAMA